MSYIGEARGFAKIRDQIRRRLDTEQLSPVERTRLLEQEAEADLEYRCAWSSARQEAMADDDHDTEPDDSVNEDDCKY